MKKGFVSPELANKIIERANGSCESCRKRIYRGEIHHIVNRHVEATEENLIFLCKDCHTGENGCHGRDGAPLWLSMRLALQDKYYQQGKTEDEVRKLMGGKIYIEK